MIYAYARVSTEEQGASLPVQISYMKKIAGDEPFTPIEEKGSGKDTNRPQLQHILNTIQEGDTLMVYDSSRLSRNTEDALEIARTLQRKNCNLVIAGKKIDIGQPIDKMLLTISAGFDTFQRDIQNLKSREGIEAKKQAGEWVVRGDLFGWRTYKTKGQTIAQIDPVASKYINYIFEQYATGRSANDISRELENIIVPGFERYRFTLSNITRMLRKPLYMGYYCPQKTDVHKMSRDELESILIKSTVYPEIVSPELWWNVFDNYRLVKRTHAKQYPYKWSSYELSTIFRCPYCNVGWAHYYYKGKHDHVLEKYKALAHKCTEGCYRMFDKNAMETIMRMSLILTFIDHDEVECFFKSERDKVGVEKTEMESELENIEKMMSQNKKKMEKLTDLAMDDLIDRDSLRERMGKLKEENTELMSSKNALLTAIRQKDAFIDDLLADLTKDVLEEYSQLSPTLRRDTLRKYLVHAWVRNEGFEIEFLNGKRFITDMWPLMVKNLKPLHVKVYFKDEFQYEVSCGFRGEGVKLKDEDYGDSETNLFFYNRNRGIERKVNDWLGKM